MVGLKNQLLGANIPLEENCPLAKYGSFRIGGVADLGLFPKDRQEMLTCLRLLAQSGVPYTVIGKGSNVVFPDGRYSGVMVFTGHWQQITRQESCIYASAGVSLYTLSVAARDASLGGAEFAYGIPGTLGGAVLMNAGAFGGCMADICLRSEYFDAQTGETGFFAGAEQAFANRTSIYEKHPRYTVLGAELALTPDDKAAITARMEDYMARRRSTQPLEFPSAGSVFKRPVGHFAGKLIEDCGLKGVTVGGAQVSQKHAGFIINRGGATASDVKALVELIRTRVLSQTGVELECEIRFI